MRSRRRTNPARLQFCLGVRARERLGGRSHCGSRYEMVGPGRRRYRESIYAVVGGDAVVDVVERWWCGAVSWWFVVYHVVN